VSLAIWTVIIIGGGGFIGGVLWNTGQSRTYWTAKSYAASLPSVDDRWQERDTVRARWESERVEPVPIPMVAPAPIVNVYLAPGWMQQLPQAAPMPVFDGRVIDPAELLALPEAHGTVQ
jgi:hypothetical protein